MKGSILIFGGNRQQRQEEAQTLVKKISREDILQIDVLEGKKSLGIEQIRQGITFINKKPFSSQEKALNIPQADKLTTEAQNALLKILEEPPAYAVIILQTTTQESLLPTVLSRCRKIQIRGDKNVNKSRAGEEAKTTGASLQKIKKMSVQEKFDWAQETAKEEKDEVLDLLEQFIIEERIYISSSENSVQNIKLILGIKKDLERTNINTRLALETMALNLL